MVFQFNQIGQLCVIEFADAFLDVLVQYEPQELPLLVTVDREDVILVGSDAPPPEIKFPTICRSFIRSIVVYIATLLQISRKEYGRRIN